MYDLILKNISRFIQLTAEETHFFTSQLKLKHVNKKEFLIQEGEICRYIFYVNKGCLRTFFVDPKGTEHNVLFAIDDWWTGDLQSFNTQTAARYNIAALEDTDAVLIEKDALEELYTKIPKLEKLFRHLYQNALISLQDRVLSTMCDPAEVRYQTFRRKYPIMDSRIPQNQIASFLGITPESLSRIRKQIADKK